MNPKKLISVSTQVPVFQLADAPLTYRLGIINRRALEEGQRVAAPVGGAAVLKPDFAAYLRTEFEAEFQREPEDAIFSVPEHRLAGVLELFRCIRDDVDVRPEREILEELGGIELPGQIEAILSADEARSIKVTSRGVVEHDYVPPAGAVVKRWNHPAYYLFHSWSAVVSRGIFAKLRASPFVYLYAEHELPARDPGTGAGLAADGTYLAPTLFM